jgi:hypothetical protein
VNADDAQVPWGLSDARTSFFTTAGGLGAVLLAWWGASGTGQLDRQTGWTVAGIVGIIVLGMGNAFWLLAGRRAVGARRARVLDMLESLGAGRPVGAAPSAAFVAVAGSNRYHVESCLLVRGKAVRAVRPSARGRRRPCEMCRP